MDVIAVTSALLSGVFFGLTAHVQKTALQGTDVSAGALISVATMTAVLWVLAPFFIEWHWFATQAAAIFAVCGLVFPAASQRLQVAAVQQVGPTLTSALGSLAPLFAVTLAVLFLGETLNATGALGIALMLAGLLLSALKPGGGLPRAFPVVMLLLPLGAALARGVVQPATKYGSLEINSAFFATLVMSTVATVVLFFWMLADRTRRPIRMTRRGNRHFMLNGLVIGSGILSLQVAISHGAVSLAAPLASATPLWTLVFGVMFFRNEDLTWRHLVMVLLVVTGAILVVTR